MGKKGFKLVVLLLIVILLISGCDNKTSEVIKNPEETKIRNQINKWFRAWQDKDTKVFYEAMVDEGISFKIEEEKIEDLTIKQFVELMPKLDIWYIPGLTMHIKSVNIEGNNAKLDGIWEVKMEMRKMLIYCNFYFIKSIDTWLIYRIELNKPIKEFEGDEIEDFDPDKHKSYVSFEVDGKKYVFHDHYGGVDHEMTSIVTYNNEFQIDVHNYETDVRFILSFYWEGSNKGEFKSVTWRPTDDWDDAYEYAGSDFIAKMESYNLEGGRVKGTFEGYVYKEDYEQGESVYITEGFFYIEHEFNLPVVTIEEPEGPVSGIVTLSGTVEDESEILDVNVSIRKNFDDYEEIFEREDADGTNNWTFTFDSTPHDNGEYIVKVYARDKHYNYSRVESIKIIIYNKDL